MKKTKGRDGVYPHTGRKASQISTDAPSVQTKTLTGCFGYDLAETLMNPMDDTLAQDEGKTDFKGNKRSDENFIAIGSVEDERLIKDLNKKAAGIKKADSIKKESKEVEGLECRKLESYMVLKLIRFVKKLIAELEPENSNGDGKDL
ncbi:hypothetical protein Tco_1282722 [Tanacetum coccineum]